MTYNLELAERMRRILLSNPQVSEKKMFGGTAFMIHGNLACGVHGDGMIVRVGETAHAETMQKPGVHPFDMTGKPMKGWVVVEAARLQSEADLAGWIDAGMSFASSLPPKK